MQVTNQNITVTTNWDTLENRLVYNDNNFSYAAGTVYTITNNGAYPIRCAVMAETPDFENCGRVLQVGGSMSWTASDSEDLFLRGIGGESSVCVES